MYTVLCERNAWPTVSLGKLLKDRFPVFTEHYNAEAGFTKAEGEFSELEPVLVGFKELWSALLTQCPSVRIPVIQTLVDSWSTSCRIHEHKIHKCLFCGGGEDELHHYLNCSVKSHTRFGQHE